MHVHRERDILRSLSTFLMLHFLRFRQEGMEKSLEYNNVLSMKKHKEQSRDYE